MQRQYPLPPNDFPCRHWQSETRTHLEPLVWWAAKKKILELRGGSARSAPDRDYVDYFAVLLEHEIDVVPGPRHQDALEVRASGSWP
jgi:hypothetical protein